MLSQTSAYLAAVILFGFSTYVGLIPINKMIKRREAQHELQIGSASQIKRLGGWTLVIFWLVCVAFASTVIGDWAATGNLDAATDRGWQRLGALMHIFARLGGIG